MPDEPKQAEPESNEVVNANAQGAEGEQSTPDISGLVSKNRELLSELKKWQAKAKKYETEAEARERESLEKDKKFEALYEKEKARAAQKEAEALKLSREMTLKEKALSAGISPKYLKFVTPQLNSVEWGEDGPVGIEEFFAGLKAEAPLFFGTEPQEPTVKPQVRIDGGKPGLTGAGLQTFTRDQIKNMSPAEFKEKEKEIDRQYAAGLIN